MPGRESDTKATRGHVAEQGSRLLQSRTPAKQVIPHRSRPRLSLRFAADTECDRGA